MPSCGSPVYQPTTVSYEPRSGADGHGGGAGLGLLGVATSLDSPLRVFRKKRSQMCLLAFSILCIVTGIAMIASGLSTTWESNEVKKIVEEDEVRTLEPVIPYAEIPIGIIVGGSFILLFGILFCGFYLKFADWRRQCGFPFFNKKQSLARQFNSCQNAGSSGGQGIMALNPSTDPLVSHTQYAPVSELPRPDDEERRNLMPDNKDCLSSAEESDRMLEPDPRILLRPMGHVEDA